MASSLNVLLYFVCILTVGLIVWGVIDSRRLYRFTVLFAASFASFAIPQMIGLATGTGAQFNGLLPEGAHDILMLVSLLCLVAVWLGDNRGVNHPGSAVVRTMDEYDSDRLVRVAFFFTITAIIINQSIRFLYSVEDMEKLGNQWSGPITILMFFQSMYKYGLALAVLMYLRTRSPLALLCALFGILANTVSFFVSARRGATIDTVFIVILALYFGRRLLVPAWLLGLMFAFGTLWSHSIGAFRAQDETSFMERLEKADLYGQFSQTLNNGGWEIANASIHCWCADFEGEYDFGKIHWNQLVHAYFPGQIFGHELKKSIKFEETDLPKQLLNYTPPVGSTSTGMADAFCSFWYLGCLKYYFIGYVMGRWWNRANRGDIAAQLTYMALMGAALHTITHGTYWLMNGYIHVAIFAYPALYWARQGVQPKVRVTPVPKSRALVQV